MSWFMSMSGEVRLGLPVSPGFHESAERVGFPPLEVKGRGKPKRRTAISTLPKADALPDCATPREKRGYYTILDPLFGGGILI